MSSFKLHSCPLCCKPSEKIRLPNDSALNMFIQSYWYECEQPKCSVSKFNNSLNRAWISTPFGAAALIQILQYNGGGKEL